MSTSYHGPLEPKVPRATLFGGREWTSTLLPRYQRPEVNEAIAATYLAGGNTRRIRGALQPLLEAAPLSKCGLARGGRAQGWADGVADALARRRRCHLSRRARSRASDAASSSLVVPRRRHISATV
jgi:hypothetical protein